MTTLAKKETAVGYLISGYTSAGYYITSGIGQSKNDALVSIIEKHPRFKGIVTLRAIEVELYDNGIFVSSFRSQGDSATYQSAKEIKDLIKNAQKGFCELKK